MLFSRKAFVQETERKMNLMLRSSRLLILVFIISLVILAFVELAPEVGKDGQFGSNLENTNLEPHDQDSSILVEKTEASAPDRNEKKKKRTERLKQQISLHGIEDLLGKAGWNRARGYGLSGYESYDRDTLDALVANGDVQAMHTLGKMLSKEDPNLAIEYLEMAAATGYTSSISEISLIYRRIGWRGSVVPGVQRDSTKMVDAYAWNLVLQIRNDIQGLNQNRFLMEQGQVTIEEVEQACQLADTIYERLLIQRFKRGLPEFDNAPPPRSSRDLSSLGGECKNWPFKNATCDKVPLSEEFYDTYVFACTNTA